MDDPHLDGNSHRRALDGLGRINFWSRTARHHVRILAKWVPRGGSLRVLDLACGGGDVVLALERLGLRAGLQIRVDGCDVSQTAVEHAMEKAGRTTSRARFFRHDVLQSPLPEDYDVLISSLFLHHLAEEEVTRLLEKMARSCRQGSLISDLERRPAGYWLAATVPHLLSRSPVVHTDAVRSARAAFSMDELAQLARKAGLGHFELSRRWPCRMLLSWRKSL